MPKVGRPPLEYDPAIGDEICDRLVNGESLYSITRDDHMPAPSTVYKWLAAQDGVAGGFTEQYTRAREDQADTLADQILSIADCTQHDTIPGTEDQPERANSEWINRSRLRVDARKWVAAKLKPKKYSDKLDLTSKGEKIGSLDALRAAEERDRQYALKRDKGEE